MGRTTRRLQGQADSSAIANKSVPSNIKCDGFFVVEKKNFFIAVKVKKTNKKMKKIVTIIVR